VQRLTKPIPVTHDAEMDAIVAELEKAGLVETFTSDQGKVPYRLTPKGAQLGRSMALAGDEDAAVVLDALLEG
jgi:DNA-binding MarR family transcriptional regulator